MSNKKKVITSLLVASAFTAICSFSAGALLLPGGSAFVDIPQFTASDLDGNKITNDIFSEKDVTMINIWGTFCSPCVGEMPELAEIAEDLPENQQIVGLLIDVTGEDDPNYELAKQILEKAGVEYPQIIANDDFTNFLNTIEGVPTTYFVDKDGNILDDCILGADVDAYRERLEEYAKQYPKKSDVRQSGETDTESEGADD